MQLPSERPRTHFDSLTLGTMEQVFRREVRERRVYDRAQFRAMLRAEPLCFPDARVIDYLYEIFDVNDDGMLDVEEAGTGLLLLAPGSPAERRRAGFSFFDAANNDTMMKREMQTYLSAFTRIALATLGGVLDRLSELFGEPSLAFAQGSVGVASTVSVVSVA